MWQVVILTARVYPGLLSIKQPGVLLLSLDGMLLLVHRRAIPPTSIKFAGTHLYTWVERSTVTVKCLAQKHNEMTPARAQSQIARSRVQCTDH